MKYRTDFVTNSSSSSFLLGFDSKEEGEKTIIEMARKYGSMYIDQLLADFLAAKPLTLEEIISSHQDDFENDAELDLDGEYYWGRRKKSFQETWMESHPGATFEDYYASRERKEAVESQVKQVTKDLLEKARQKSYLVEVEYEDHDEVGSGLEHDILPDQDFTIRRFNHH